MSSLFDELCLIVAQAQPQSHPLDDEALAYYNEGIEHYGHAEPEKASREAIERTISIWRSLRGIRLLLEKRMTALSDLEKAAKSFAIAAMRSQRMEGVVADHRYTVVTEKPVPIVEDKAALTKYILDTGALDLLQFRLSVTAVKERAQAGVAVPGVGTMMQQDLSDKKL